MYELLGLDVSIKFFSYLMLSLAFFIGIMLAVSQEAVEHFNTALKKEVGLKTRLIPQLENTEINFIDWIILKHSFFSGILISVTAFFLLLAEKI